MEEILTGPCYVNSGIVLLEYGAASQSSQRVGIQKGIDSCSQYLILVVLDSEATLHVQQKEPAVRENTSWTVTRTNRHVCRMQSALWASFLYLHTLTRPSTFPNSNGDSSEKWMRCQYCKLLRILCLANWRCAWNKKTDIIIMIHCSTKVSVRESYEKTSPN